MENGRSISVVSEVEGRHARGDHPSIERLSQN
jgi:hypothetical protein